MKINKIIGLTTIAFVVFFSSCKLIDKLTKFDVNYSTNYTIPASLVPGILGDIFTPDITTNSEQIFTNNNTKADLLEQVNLKSLQLTITSPSGKTFDFLKSASVFVSADGLPEVKIAYIDNIDDSVGNSISLNATGVELKEYLKKSKIKIRVANTTDKIVSENVTIKIDAVFFVDAKILGV
ncbi:MAG TPA: hypothetical protein PKK18_06705 [Chitinophagales bacterium]|nr:hypothetical protein [Chitinophagales bacterium]HMW13355.1 hypothetical protein [Chitinophagales bacterium]HMX61249.1 hypothetical protein [Chitinophagales bacterium]HMY23938.1 hypothetical protein [Chitinophagales bacterium]HMZ34285.1 hypothetical protein [Chitinophagales bacterium]